MNLKIVFDIYSLSFYFEKVLINSNGFVEIT